MATSGQSSNCGAQPSVNMLTDTHGRRRRPGRRWLRRSWRWRGWAPPPRRSPRAPQAPSPPASAAPAPNSHPAVASLQQCSAKSRGQNTPSFSFRELFCAEDDGQLHHPPLRYLHKPAISESPACRAGTLCGQERSGFVARFCGAFTEDTDPPCSRGAWCCAGHLASMSAASRVWPGGWRMSQI